MPQWNPLPSETVATLRDAADELVGYSETIASTEPEDANLQQVKDYVLELAGQLKTLCTEHDRFKLYWQPKP
jgi:hypothetical protein